MLDEKTKIIADQKGLTIDKEDNGFSVKKDGNQIRFFFNVEKLLVFLEEYDEEKFLGDLEVKKKPEPEKSQASREPVVSKTIIEVKEVVITDIQMRFISMVIFMVKWSIASIPALIILAIIYYVGETFALWFLGLIFSEPL